MPGRRSALPDSAVPDERIERAGRLSDLLRTLVTATDRYGDAVGAREGRHRTHLAALSLLMDADREGRAAARSGRAASESAGSEGAGVESAGSESAASENPGSDNPDSGGPDKDDRGLTPGSLGAALGLSSPATTALIDRLEFAGHARRERGMRDRRRVLIRLTPDARQLGGELYGPLFAQVVTALDDIPPAEVEAAMRVMSALVAATDAAIDDVRAHPPGRTLDAANPAAAGSGRATP